MFESFDAWQEHQDYELFASFDDVRERYASSAIDHALEAAMDEAAALDHAADRLRRRCPALDAVEAEAAVRALWAMPLDSLDPVNRLRKGVAERATARADARRWAAWVAGEPGDDNIPF